MCNVSAESLPGDKTTDTGSADEAIGDLASFSVSVSDPTLQDDPPADAEAPLSVVTAEQLSETTFPPKTSSCVIISLIRHTQSEANRDDASHWDPFGPPAARNQSKGDRRDSRSDVDTPLTSWGHEQAEALGKAWSDTRLDHLYSSDLSRAKDTALGIRKHHSKPVNLELNTVLREHDVGQIAADYLSRGDNESYRWDVGGTFENGHQSRTHKSRGGESLDEVRLRALHFVRTKLQQLAIKMECPPALFNELVERNAQLRRFRDDAPKCKVGDLIEGVPHVVIVSHNEILMELFEWLVSPGNEEPHVWTDVKWKNTGWSRHILWFDADSEVPKSTLLCTLMATYSLAKRDGITAFLKNCCNNTSSTCAETISAFQNLHIETLQLNPVHSFDRSYVTRPFPAI